jgi:signal transduction histidine kinase
VQREDIIAGWWPENMPELAVRHTIPAPGREGGVRAASFAHELAGRIPALAERIGTRLAAAGSLPADDTTWTRYRERVVEAILACVRQLQNPGGHRHDRGPRAAATGDPPVRTLPADAVVLEVVAGELTDIAAMRPELAPVVVRALGVLNAWGAARLRSTADAAETFAHQQVQEAKRECARRFGREVHDHIGNSISLALRQLELYQAAHGVDDAAAHRRVGQAREALTEALANSRQVVSGLRVSTPVTSVRDAVRSFVAAAGIGEDIVEIRLSGDESRLPERVRGEVFTIVREALRNAFQHSGASRFLVRLEVGCGTFHAWVEDDGAGFDPAAVPGTRHGLRSMADRAEGLGGTLSFGDAPGGGASVWLTVPLEEHGRVA